jgi:hypothetical protein
LYYFWGSPTDIKSGQACPDIFPACGGCPLKLLEEFDDIKTGGEKWLFPRQLDREY